MILVDTSVWIDHLRSGDEILSSLLEGNRVLMHPFVLGELACGNLRQRREVLGLLSRLPAATAADDPEVLVFIDRYELMGRGIGYVHAHLLASAALSAPATVWTRDKRLHAAAADLRLAHDAR
ncbi:MAG: PIN domain-containing protein [Gammaproteobacteria bacterium]|nr:MAG: PIN domain-containing protein [Gammaproteobacteria bacterium]